MSGRIRTGEEMLEILEVLDLLHHMRQEGEEPRGPMRRDVYQPHDPQDWEERNPMSPMAANQAVGFMPSDHEKGVGEALLQLLDSPPLSGGSRMAGAMLEGQDPLHAFGDMTGDSPYISEAMRERGVNPWLAMGTEFLVPELASIGSDAADLLRLAVLAPSLLRGGQAAGRGAMNVDSLLGLVKDKGGFTLDPTTGKLAKNRGFAVGGLGPEMRLPATDVTAQDLTSYITQNASTLSAPNARLGAWIDDATGEVVFDISEQVVKGYGSPRQSAFTRAIASGEDAIFDLAAGQSLYIQSPLGSPTLRGDRSIIRPGDPDWIGIDDMPFYRSVKEDVLARQAAGLDITDYREGSNADIFLARTEQGRREPWVTNRLENPDALKLTAQDFYKNMLETPHGKSFKSSVENVRQNLPDMQRQAQLGIQHQGHVWYHNDEILDVFLRAHPDDPVSGRATFEWHMAINALNANNSDPYKQVTRAFLVDSMLHTKSGREMFFAATEQAPYNVQEAVLQSFQAGNNAWADIHSYIVRMARDEVPMFDVNGAHKLQTYYPHNIGSTVNVTGDRWAARSAGVKESLIGSPHHYAATEWGFMQLTEMLNEAGPVRLTHPDTQAAVWVGKQIEEGVDPRMVSARFSDIWMGGVREYAERVGIPFAEAQTLAAQGRLPLPEIIGVTATVALMDLIVGKTDNVDWSMSMLDEEWR